jgi:glycosyltransferase involved in cell wall biosynthesis
MWSRLLGRLGPTTIVTRANNRPNIERTITKTPEFAQLEFIYVDLPRWARFWKKGKRGARIYYILWQFAALRQARTVLRRSRIDVVWHVTLANFWLGSVGALLNIPFVFGPVGGGVPSCYNIRIVGLKGLMFESARSLGRVFGRWANPLARVAWSRASLILVNNPETRDAMPRRHREKCIIFPHMILENDPERTAVFPPGVKSALFAGRLIGWKGCSLAIRAVALLPDCRLLVCGQGPEERRLKRLARRLGTNDRVEFLGWVGRADVHRLMRDRAHVFVFPGLHEEGGWAGCEAVAHGLPVVCLDRGGPPVVAGRGVAIGSVTDMAADLAAAIADAQPGQPSTSWDIDTRHRDLESVLHEFHLRPATVDGPRRVERTDPQALGE